MTVDTNRGPLYNKNYSFKWYFVPETKFRCLPMQHNQIIRLM